MRSKLLAIMLTDISGYTAFSSNARHEDITEAIKQQQKLITPIINSFHGRIVKWIGDAALAVFESATDAILAAREIQNTFIGHGERGAHSINPLVKTVVHLGDVMVDQDGDIYGDPVNYVARMEKQAEPDQVYFSEAVKTSIPRAEIPYDFVGSFEFKGIHGKVNIYKSSFSNTPVIRDRVALVNTNFVGLSDLSDKYTWDVIQPVVDDAVGIVLSSCREFGDNKRGTNSGRCFLSFNSITDAINAITKWTNDLNNLDIKNKNNINVKMRTSVHWGTLHVMRNTIMGKDMHITEVLCALGFGDEILLTEPAVNAAKAENLNTYQMIRIPVLELRVCSSRSKWQNKFENINIYKIDLSNACQSIY